jgi:WD40 repeat protein
MADTPVLVNPFPGLRPFTFDESHLFFGREGQSDALLTRLCRRRFVAVVGTSGSGKSSLVRAGLLPALYGGFMTPAGSSWRVAVLRPGNDPMGNLALALNAPDVLGAGNEDPVVHGTLIETTLRRSTLGLVDTVQQARLLSYENLLIVVDQFEELFRFRQLLKRESADDEATPFVKLLLEATRQHKVPIYIVLTMRSDYLGDCAQFRDLPEAINDGQYLIPRLTREQLRLAITGPVAVGGATITPRLVHRLLNDVGDNPDQLPILQHALMRLWDYWEQHNAPTEPLDLSHYEAIGGMAEALSHHADEAYAALPDDQAREMAQKLFQCLTEKGPDNREIRRPATLQEACAVAEAAEAEMLAVIEHFRRPGRSFLMPPSDVKLMANTVLDISHESLMRLWQRLRTWVDEEAQSAQVYRRLAETAALNAVGQAGLWRDPDLHLAREWRVRHRPNAVWAQRYHAGFVSAMAFLEASEQAQTAEVLQKEAQQRQTLRRTRLFAAILSVAFLLALGAGWYANEQRKRADEQRKDAEVQRFIAQNLRLREKTETVKQLLSVKPVEALGWAIRAAGQSLTESGQVLSLVQASLMQAVSQAREQNVFSGHEGPVQSVAFSLDGQRIASGGDDGRLLVWDFTGSRIGCALHTEAITAVTWSADGKTIASGGADRVVRLWDRDGHPEGQLPSGLQGTVNAITISLNGKLFASGSDDTSVTLWDLGTRQPIGAFTGHTDRVNAVTFSPDGALLASVSNDLTVKLWDVISHEEVVTLTGHKFPVHTAAFSPDGRLLASANGIGPPSLIKIWDIATRREIASFLSAGARVDTLTFSPDSYYITGGTGNVVQSWDIKGQAINKAFFVGQYALSRSVALSLDGKTIASGGIDGTVRLWDSRSQYVTPFAGYGGVNWIAFSPDGSRLVSAGAGSSLSLWDVEGGFLGLLGNSRDQKQPMVVAFSPSGKLIASGGQGIIQLWDLQGQPVGPPFTGHQGEIWALAFSPNGQQLVSGSEDHTIRLWDLEGKLMGQPFTGHTDAVRGVAFSPDGQRIVSGSVDETVRLWDLQGSMIGQPFIGHTAPVMAVAFSPDGKTIVSGSHDGKIRLWDLKGALRHQFSVEKSGIEDVALSPDGKHIVSGGDDRIVRV